MALVEPTLVSKPAASKIFRSLFFHLLRERFAFISDTQLHPIADIQFNARHQSYHFQWPNALWSVIYLPENLTVKRVDNGSSVSECTINNTPVGYVVVNYAESETRIIDLYVRQEFRGQGIASQVLTQVIQQSHKNNLPCILTVGVENSAITLYEKLHFIEVARTQTDILMKVAAPGSQ